VRPCVTTAALGQPQAGSHGLAFSFSLSESTHVTFTVMHHVESPTWASCAEAQKPHGHKPGTYRTVGEVSHPVPAGPQTVSIGTAAGAPHMRALVPFGPGRHRINLAGIATEHLHPGTYTLLVKAVNATGQTSGLSLVHFWVVR
jgi:hypothetical protein